MRTIYLLALFCWAMQPADKPLAGDLEYHTHTKSGDLAALCLIVGAGGRADMIARRFLKNSRRFANENRGIVSHTGEYKGIEVSVTTSGMGGPSIGIVLPESVRSGARLFIRVGTCGSLIPHSKLGEPMIPTAAVRYDGASDTWAPPVYPAFATWQVVRSLHGAASILAPGRFHSGVESTTADFYGGQGRPNLFRTVSDDMGARHREMMRLGVACYSMEASALFVWCATEGGGLPCGAVNAIVGNRHTNEWQILGEELASEIALEALLDLNGDPTLADYINRRLPKYPE